VENETEQATIINLLVGEFALDAPFTCIIISDANGHINLHHCLSREMRSVELLSSSPFHSYLSRHTMNKSRDFATQVLKTYSAPRGFARSDLEQAPIQLAEEIKLALPLLYE